MYTGLSTIFFLAVVPGLVVLGVLAAMMLGRRRVGWTLGCAVVGCLLAAGSPWLATWFVRNVLGDNTANIGGMFLVFAQPILAPIGAGVGAAVGSAIGGQRGENGDDTGGPPPVV